MKPPRRRNRSRQRALILEFLRQSEEYPTGREAVHPVVLLAKAYGSGGTA